MLELRTTRAAVVTCLGSADAVEAAVALGGAASGRVAPDEAMLVVPDGRDAALLAAVTDATAAVDGAALVLDTTDGWSIWTVTGDPGEVDRAMARLTALELPGDGFCQGDLARVPVKLFVRPGRVHILVPSMWRSYLRARILTRCATLQIRERPEQEPWGGIRVTGLLRERTFLRTTDVKPHYDVAIVGGGVNGLSLAYHLAEQQGITKVAVFERAYIGSGGSGRNTQVVRANYNTPETVPLYKASLEIWRTLSAELDFNILWSPGGELDLVHTVDALEVERDKSLLNRAYGVATDILTVDEVVKMCPLVDVTGGGELPVLGASYHPPGSIAHHDSVVWGYAAAAQRRGVEVHEGVAVSGLDVREGVCHGVQTDAGPVSAGTVVSAVAGYSSVLADMAGLKLPISTHPLQAFVTEPYGHVLDGLVSSMDLYVYISQTARGELLVGAEIVPYNTYSMRSTFDFLAEAAKRTMQILPFVAKARAMRQWTGLCDMTPDSSPLLGESAVRNFFLMSGMGTWGFKGSPIFGRTMAEMIATGRTPDLIAPFAPDRFERDRMVPDAASAGTH